MTQYVGEQSPKSTEDFKAMSVEEIVSFLSSWTPTSGFMAPNRSGAASALSTAVAEQPERFAGEAAKFVGLSAPYVRAVLSGLEQAIRAKKSFPWREPVNLCTWVVQQTESAYMGTVRLDPLEDPGWEWAHAAAADLMTEALNRQGEKLDPLLSDPIWTIIEAVTKHPDPSVEQEERFGASMDPQTMSLNSTRGKAMHAVVAFAWWVHKQLQDSHPQDFMRLMARIRTVLDEHLNPDIDPSLSIRAVYGQWFPRLFAIDRDWAIENVDRIFPASDGEAKLWEAAWAAYLASWGVYVELFELLRGRYKLAVDRLCRPLELRGLADPKQQLAAHLMALIWSNKLSLGDPLLEAFWSSAAPEIRGFALEVIGRWLNVREQTLEEDLVKRLVELWDYRVGQAIGNENARERSPEVGAFHLWFGSRRFEAHWAIDKFEQSLDLIDLGILKERGLRGEVVARLLELAEPFSLQTVRCLRKLIAADKTGWEVRVYEKQFMKILSTALEQGGEPTQIAESVINDLWARGYRQYGELLNSPA